MSILCHWMQCLGFKYEVRKKGYCVDGHEKPSKFNFASIFLHGILLMSTGLITGYRLM